MASALIDGKVVSSKILGDVKRTVVKLKKSGIHPKLAFILSGDNPASVAYVRQKKKACDAVDIAYKELCFDAKVSTKKVLDTVERLNRDKKYHGILVQLPLPAHIDSEKVLAAIAPHKDVDGFHAYNIGTMFLSKKNERLTACTPAGVLSLLEYYKIPVEGKEAVVIGRSNIVGKPLAVMLINRGATVTVCHSKTKNVAAHTKVADLVFVAAGVPKLLKADMVRHGCVVVDVGFSRVNGHIVGDVDFDDVSKKSAWITPVPGGVGPMTVACLMQNIVRAAVRKT